MELTGKQKRSLRSLGRQLKPLCEIGKAGMSGEVVKNIRQLLDKHELIKVRFRTGDSDDRDSGGEELAKATGAACIAVVGRMVLLYKPNEQLEKRIVI